MRQVIAQARRASMTLDFRGTVRLDTGTEEWVLLHANLRFDGFGYAEDALAARDDLLLLHDVFGRVERQVLGALLGLNRRYLPPPTSSGWTS